MGGPNLYIHAGPGKTATTFLQGAVFDRIKSARTFSKPNISLGEDMVQFGDMFDLSPRVWRALEEDPFTADGSEPEVDVVISDEMIFGGLASPRPWIPGSVSARVPLPRPRRHTYSRPSPCLVLCHLEELCEVSSNWGYDQVKFLLTTRCQDTKLASSYAQISNRVRGAGQQSFKDWVRYLLYDPIGYNKGGGEKLNYSVWWKGVTEVIGEENVQFLPFELLQEDSHAFLERWLGFIGIAESDSIARSLSDTEKEYSRSVSEREWFLREPLRTGPSLPAGRVLRALGLPFQIPLRWPDFQRDDRIHLTENLTEGILNIYGEGNRLLDTINHNLNLRKYGYY